jgi:Uma2 family endonuclease
MSLPIYSFSEPITEPEVLESIKVLPTEDDLPYDDGEPMETERHLEQMIILIQSLKGHWSDRKNYYVGGNMFIHYDPKSKKKFRGPDFFVVLNVEDRERKSWVVWQEGMRFPNLIIELLSNSTREIDLGEKKDLYAQVFHTAEYYVYDPFTQEFKGYKLQEDWYEEVEPDEEGKIYSKVTGLYLVIREGGLRWMTQEGVIVPTPSQRAEQERQRAERAEQQLEEYRRRFGSLE